jgi:hypothetical protein
VNVAQTDAISQQNDPRPHLHQTRNRWLLGLGSVLLIPVIALGIAAEYILHNAEPILRKRVIETLSERFNAPVQLDALHISLVKGIEVSGDGLRVPYGGPSNPAAPGPPHVAVTVDHFAFRSTFKALLHSPTRIMTVYVDNMTIDLPPHHGDILGPDQKAAPADPTHPRTQPKIALLVNQIRCKNTRLILETSKPDKEPKVFVIQNLILQGVGASQPFTYQASLINPVPKGEIHADGHFGPWDTDDPRSTPVDGNYTFTHADLNTIKGLGGILSSVGHFSGVLQRLTVDGITDTPDFSLDVSGHPMPLHTDFHAFVDATNGDTTLEPVTAALGKSSFTCSGTVANMKHKGHDIALNVMMPHGRMQDVLALSMKTEPPVMRGAVSLKAKLHIPPGDVRVAQKLQLAGTLHILNVEFSSAKLQDRVDSLSMRAQGKPQDVKQAGNDRKPEVASDMAVTFSLTNAMMVVPNLDYKIPGADVHLIGAYTLDGNVFEFRGHVRTEATASQMVTGWKSWLLRPVDPFLKKDGAGVQLPISISGEHGDFRFGLAMHDGDKTTQQIVQDIHDRQHAEAAERH